MRKCTTAYKMKYKPKINLANESKKFMLLSKLMKFLKNLKFEFKFVFKFRTLANHNAFDFK